MAHASYLESARAMAQTLTNWPGFTPPPWPTFAPPLTESAMALMGNEELRVIAAELVNAVRGSASVDWWRKDNVRTKMRAP